VPDDPKPAPTPKGLFCPDCRGERLFVVKARKPCPGKLVRSRECSACGLRVTTVESIRAVRPRRSVTTA
jgi:transcriptional regulator NrdR family protein